MSEYSKYVQNFTSYGKQKYQESYQYIQTWISRTFSNDTIHYGTGVSLGIVASFLIFIIILTRLLPSRLITIRYILLLFGMSACMWIFCCIHYHLVSESTTEKYIHNWQYIAGYFVVVVVISFTLFYQYGPVNYRSSLSLVHWLLLATGLLLVYNTTQIREVSVALVFLLLAIYSFPKPTFKWQAASNIWHRFFPHRIHLLTKDEYTEQGRIETQKELEKLREYCCRPDFHTWKVINNLQNPRSLTKSYGEQAFVYQEPINWNRVPGSIRTVEGKDTFKRHLKTALFGRFAEFVEGKASHVTAEELSEYDFGPDPIVPHLIIDDLDDESEVELLSSLRQRYFRHESHDWKCDCSW